MNNEAKYYYIYSIQTASSSIIFLSLLVVIGYFNFAVSFRIIISLIYFMLFMLSRKSIKQFELGSGKKNLILIYLFIILITLLCEIYTITTNYLITNKAYFRGITLLFVFINSHAIYSVIRINKITQNDFTERIFELAAYGTPCQLENAFKSGGNVNVQTNTGETPLMYASKFNGNPKVIELFIKAGAAVNKKNKHGVTSLMFAAAENTNAIKPLLNAGANINAQSNDGITALMLAIIVENSQSVELLKQEGADSTLKDYRGKTAHDHFQENIALKNNNN